MKLTIEVEDASDARRAIEVLQAYIERQDAHSKSATEALDRLRDAGRRLPADTSGKPETR